MKSEEHVPVQPLGKQKKTQDREGHAKKFGIEVKTVNLVREVVAEVLATGDSAIKVTPEIERLVEQAADERIEQLVEIVRDLIERAAGVKLPRDTAESQKKPVGAFDHAFDQKMINAVFGLSRKDQEKLLKKLEMGQW